MALMIDSVEFSKLKTTTGKELSGKLKFQIKDPYDEYDTGPSVTIIYGDEWYGGAMDFLFDDLAIEHAEWKAGSKKTLRMQFAEAKWLFRDNRTGDRIQFEITPDKDPVVKLSVSGLKRMHPASAKLEPKEVQLLDKFAALVLHKTNIHLNRGFSSWMNIEDWLAQMQTINKRGSIWFGNNIDRAIPEFFLGEVMQEFERFGERDTQLIATATNCRLLETVCADFLFATQNPDNAYIRLKGVQPNMSMRRSYFRAITVAGQDEYLLGEMNIIKLREYLRDDITIEELMKR